MYYFRAINREIQQGLGGGGEKKKLGDENFNS
jgi:hypothetical protein